MPLPKMVELARTEDIAIFGGTDGKVYPVSLQAADDRDMPFRGPGEPGRIMSQSSMVIFEDEAGRAVDEIYLGEVLVHGHRLRVGYNERRNLWIVKGQLTKEAHNATER